MCSAQKYAIISPLASRASACQCDMVCYLGWWKRTVPKCHCHGISERESEMLVRAALTLWFIAFRCNTLFFLLVIIFFQTMIGLFRKADVPTPSLIQCLPEKHSLGVISCSINCDSTGQGDMLSYYLLVLAL